MKFTVGFTIKFITTIPTIILKHITVKRLFLNIQHLDIFMNEKGFTWPSHKNLELTHFPLLQCLEPEGHARISHIKGRRASQVVTSHSCRASLITDRTHLKLFVDILEIQINAVNYLNLLLGIAYTENQHVKLQLQEC